MAALPSPGPVPFSTQGRAGKAPWPHMAHDRDLRVSKSRPTGLKVRHAWSQARSQSEKKGERKKKKKEAFMKVTIFIKLPSCTVNIQKI